MDRIEAIGLLRATQLQIDEVVSLVKETDQCMEALRRIHSVQTRLRQVHDGLLASHLEHCLARAQCHEDRLEPALDGIRDVFCCMYRAGW